MSCLARSLVGLIFGLLRRASVEALSRDDLTELMRLLRSLSMAAAEETTVKEDLCRLRQLLDQSEIFQTGTISMKHGQAAAEIGQAVMLRLSDDNTGADRQSESR